MHLLLVRAESPLPTTLDLPAPLEGGDQNSTALPGSGFQPSASLTFL